ncbi:MAG: cimH [Sporomusa sp.]|jgi:Na+/citrate or Na+/malate symporter|nr:cimH [Sporomusa sp.]
MTQNTVNVMERKKTIKIMGMDFQYFLLFAAMVLGITFMGKLPSGMAGAIPLLMVLGTIFAFIGDRMPIIKDYFGGGAIVILFGSAALVLFNILPKYAVDTVSMFMNKGGFMEVALATLITGSLLGMDKKILVSASLRYLPCILAAQLFGLAVVGALGALIGYGFKEAILFIGLPAMGGGIAAGAIPLSKMLGEALNQSPQTILSTMVSAVALANAMAIAFGGLMDKLGKIKPEWTGNGNLLASKDAKKLDEEEERIESTLDVKQYGIGLLASMCFLIAGYLVGFVLPVIHAYAWVIILAAAVKLSGFFPKVLEDACYFWSQFFLKNFVGLLLAGLGVAMIDLNAVLQALTIQYVILVGAVVISTAVGAAFMGKMVGFYPIEAGITVGLCSTDMGGSGDLAILSASKRMVLLPFSQISTRIGGAMILILSGVLLTILV